MSKKASEEAKNSKNSEEYFGREFAYKKKGLSAFLSSSPNNETNKVKLLLLVDSVMVTATPSDSLCEQIHSIWPKRYLDKASKRIFNQL